MYQIVVGHNIESIQVTINGMYTGDNNVPIIIIIMVIFKCYFSGELIALS